jgi:hypothetical protein
MYRNGSINVDGNFYAKGKINEEKIMFKGVFTCTQSEYINKCKCWVLFIYSISKHLGIKVG